jgi:TatD DNase family protein
VTHYERTNVTHTLQKPLFTDTHTHIYGRAFDKDRNETVQRAVNTGIHRMLLPNIDSESFESMLELSAAFPDVCFPMLGLHPCSVDENFESVLQKMWDSRHLATWVGIGETGIDLYWDKTQPERQKEALKIQAQWAKDLNLPLILHVRDSFPEVFSVLDEVHDNTLRGVFHCFTGTAEQAGKIAEYGNFMMGIGGVVTYKNSHLAEVLTGVSTELLLLETDAPYLTPVPFRGQRNEPAYISYIAQCVANALQVSVNTLSELTERNVHRMFFERNP